MSAGSHGDRERIYCHAKPRCRFDLLDEPLCGAGRKRRPFISVNLNLSLDMPGEAGQQWWPLVVITGDDAAVSEADRRRRPRRASSSFSRSTPRTRIRFCPACGRRGECPRRARNHLGRDVGAHQQVLFDGSRWRHARRRARQSPRVLRAGERFGQQFLGVTDATMTHGEAWHFCQLGRMLERADKTSRILDVKYFILLPSCPMWARRSTTSSGWPCCVRECPGNVSPAAPSNFTGERGELPRARPRVSARAALPDTGQRIAPRYSGSSGQLLQPGRAASGPVAAELAYTQAEEVIAGGLHEFVDDLQTRLNLVGDAIYESFFAMRPLEAASWTIIPIQRQDKPRRHGGHRVTTK